MYCVRARRRRSGLVGPRPLVAGEELLVAKDALDAGPVRRPSGCEARLYDDAQELACSAAGSPGRGRQGQLLNRRLQRRHQIMQGIRSVRFDKMCIQFTLNM